MDDTNALAGWLRLTLAPGIGGESQRKLLRAFGLPEQIFAAGRLAVREIIGSRADALFDADTGAALDHALSWAQATAGQHILTLADAAYPQSLLTIPDPPSVLYVRGNPALLNLPTLAVVGSRNATPQGERTAQDFARALAGAGLCIASGLALGIDAAAHQGALAAKGSTLAVVGTGADRLYPARNRNLAQAIVEQGCLISEFPLGTPAMAANFPRRNRILSGLARGILVVEAALESGSLITARLAAEQGREVFAIPGSIHSPVARGCHRLIKQGAKLVETAADILEELGEINVIPANAPPAIAAEEEDSPILTALGHAPCHLDDLLARTGQPVETLLAALLSLELAGKLTGLPGNRYQRLC